MSNNIKAKHITRGQAVNMAVKEVWDNMDFPAILYNCKKRGIQVEDKTRQELFNKEKDIDNLTHARQLSSPTHTSWEHRRKAKLIAQIASSHQLTVKYFPQKNTELFTENTVLDWVYRNDLNSKDFFPLTAGGKRMQMIKYIAEACNDSRLARYGDDYYVNNRFFIATLTLLDDDSLCEVCDECIQRMNKGVVDNPSYYMRGIES